MGVLRDMLRRKGRSVLTITGIAVGVFALVVLGAASENNNVYSVKLTKYFENTIAVAEKDDSSFFGLATGARPLSMKKAAEIRAYPGVEAAFPQVNVLLDEKFFSVIPPMVMSVAPGMVEYQDVVIAEGSGLRDGERGVTVLGSDLARRMKAHVGDTVELRGTPFEVIGIGERTFINLSDASAYVGLEDARQLYVESLPRAFQAKVKSDDLAVGVMAYARDGVDPDTLARSLEQDVDGIVTTGPAEMMGNVKSMINLLNAVVASIAAVALIVGALSIVNTMMMAVTERTREIGVKRALGATRGRVARDVLAESAVMGGIGGAIGLAFGALVALGLNEALLAATGTSMFLVTGRLAVGAILFSVALGAVGGLYPATHASRLDPALALAQR